jgi:hypothetical protein
VFKFSYFDDKIRFILCDRERETLWDSELEEDLKRVLKTLKDEGEIEGAQVGRKPGVSDVVYEYEGSTFKLTYTVDPAEKEVKFFDFQQVAYRIDWENALENASNTNVNDIDVPDIPQIGDYRKYLKAIDCIYKGINTPKDLGITFESTAKKDKDIARRGYYIGKPLEEFKLAIFEKKQGDYGIYSLTERGNRIAESNDLETRQRLLVEALLGYQPIQLIIAKTSRGNQELTKELIQEVITQVTLGECGGTTNPRRASSLRALVNWVSRWAGIPIRRPGSEGIQLIIPHIYANTP